MNFFKFLKIDGRENFSILVLLISAFLIRIPIVIIYGDTEIENEWYVLLKNLTEHNILSMKDFGLNADGSINFLPNLWMPPLYAYYLYALSLIKLEHQNFLFLVLFSQALLSSISVIVFYKINKLFFSEKLSFYSSLVFSFFPLYLYSCTQTSSISLTIFISIFLYYFFFKIKYKQKYSDIFFFGLLCGLAILVRREFIAIIIFSLIYLFVFYKIPFKKIILVIIIATTTLSPYLIRNYITFDKVVLNLGFGYNLWEGNNSYAKVEGAEIVDKDFQNKIDKIPKDKHYRFKEDKIYTEEAIKNIKENPKKYFILYIKRFFSFMFIDIESSYPNYYNPFHYIPNLILGFTSLLGIIFSNKKNSLLNYLILVYLFYLFVFPIFSIQPRYKIYIISLQIIFSTIFIERLIKRIKKKI